MTDRELIWKFYSEYMAHGNLSTETLETIAARLKEPVSIADEWKLECLRVIEEMQSLQKKLDQISNK